MAHDTDALRPETVALDALIKASVAKVHAQGGPSSPDTMLFMGNWCQAIPAMVIEDPVLEPVDKLVWMVIMLHARRTGGRTAFPHYDTIATQTNVSSAATISRAIAILRLTRWLTLCARARKKSARFAANVYILHDEPLPLADAIYLDEAYVRFVTQSLADHHARVRRVAEAVSTRLNNDISEGQDVAMTQNTHKDKQLLAEACQAGPLPTDQALVYPPRLSENQKFLANRYLTMIAPEDRQLVLDELQGRLASEQKGMKPVYDELRFLHSLCRAVQNGEFVFNLGIKVAEARQHSMPPVAPPEDPAQQAQTAEERECSQAYAREQLAKLRALLNSDQ